MQCCHLPAAYALLYDNKTGVCFCRQGRGKTRDTSPFSEVKTHLAHVTYIIMAEHDSFGLACGSWGVDERAALVWLLAGDDRIEGCVRLIASELHKLGPLQRTSKIREMMLLRTQLIFSCFSLTDCVLTEYRFGLFSFSASLYWIMAFKCGSLSSTCGQTEYSLMSTEQQTSQQEDFSLLHYWL